jgi:5-carboxymethyl-2-hydroxymuconate isomerase
VPHLFLQTTADLAENDSIPEILEALTAILSFQETVDPKAVKAYHALRPTWAVGEGHPPGFASLQVSVLTGRPLELRQKIGQALMEEFKARFAYSLEQGEVGLTLEVREMERETYFKS